jgi:hypothetical protein
MAEGSNSSSGKRFSPQNVWTGFEAHPASYSTRTEVLSGGGGGGEGKQPEHEVYHSPPYSAAVKHMLSWHQQG